MDRAEQIDRGVVVLDHPQSRIGIGGRRGHSGGGIGRLAARGGRQQEEGGGRDEREQLHRGANSIGRSEEHTSELQSLMRISYAVFCLKKKKRIRAIKEEANRMQKTKSHK